MIESYKKRKETDMKFRYPMFKNYLLLKKNGDTVSVKDIYSEKKYTVTAGLADFACRLDGNTDPYSLGLSREETAEMLNTLKRYDLLRTGKVLDHSFGTLLYSFWFPDNSKSLKRFATVYNALLEFLWLPVLIAGGILLYTSCELDGGMFQIICGSVLGTLVGLVLHELSHAMAGLSYGADVFEGGVMIRFFLPGAYVLLDESRIKNRLKKVQIFAAGPEMNFLLAGLFCFAAVLFPQADSLFGYAAINSAILGFVNLSLIFGADGYRILLTLIGADDGLSFSSYFKKTVALHSRSSSSAAGLVASGVFAFSTVNYGILLLSNILGVVICFTN